MSNISIKDAIVGVLSKTMTSEQAFSQIKPEDRENFSVSLAYILEKAKFISPEQQKINRAKAAADANKDAIRTARGTSPLASKQWANTTHDENNPRHQYMQAVHDPAHRFHGVVKDTGDYEKAVKKIGEHLEAEKKAGKKLHVAGSKPSLSVVKAEMLKTDKNGQWALDKAEILEKPPVSEAQRKAMWAAAKGQSNLGIPKSVGKDFAEADAGGKLPEKKIEKEEKEMARVKVQMDSDTYEPRGKHEPVMESPKNLKKSWAPDAQWNLEKAIKPGPTLDYSQFNKKPDYAEIEAKAPTIDYGNKPTAKPTWSGAADKAKAVRAKIDSQAKETAVETIARRQKVTKDEGANIDRELDAGQQKRMVSKNEVLGYGPQGSPANAMTMSEKEPHEDDPHHEEKEKKKAKKIKEEAEKLLDMHD